jgi:hypothetical protein
LQQALILALEETQEQRKVASHQNQLNDDSSKIKNAAVALLKTAPDEQDNHDTATFASLGKEWHSLYQAALASGTIFVDSIFPPTSASLDGQRHAQTTIPTETVRCSCGLIAKSRTVQRNGPNYGQFYLSCGRQDQGKKVFLFSIGPRWQSRRDVTVFKPFMAFLSTTNMYTDILLASSWSAYGYYKDVP